MWENFWCFGGGVGRYQNITNIIEVLPTTRFQRWGLVGFLQHRTNGVVKFMETLKDYPWYIESSIIKTLIKWVFSISKKGEREKWRRYTLSCRCPCPRLCCPCHTLSCISLLLMMMDPNNEMHMYDECISLLNIYYVMLVT